MDGFFKNSDKQIKELCGVDLGSETWWSRRFEYPFALGFVEAQDIVLDAACGTHHPFKYALSELCTTYACDLDDAEINDKIIFTKCSIADLPYENNAFHKVFCISVLEHLNTDTIKASLKEFKRVLKPNGKLILTIDYPSVNIQALYEMLQQAGFTTKEKDLDMDNAISSTFYGSRLFCYHIEADNS